MPATCAATLEMLLAQICGAMPGEPRDLSMLLTLSERAEMALFCHGRIHTREQGRAIAAACTRDEMVKAGNHAGAALYDQAETKGDAWGAIARPEKARVSRALRFAANPGERAR